MSQKSNIDALLNPKSIAIVGASGNPNKRPGGRPLLYLLNQGYKGDIYPINPNCDEILGVKSYPNLKAIPDNIDVVLILRPAKATLEVLKVCEEKGIKAAVVPAAGFAETGESGREIQETINEIAARSGMAILGPNCQGIINVPERAIISFSVVAEMDLIDGKVAFVTQSGAMGSSVFGACIENGIGFRYYISTGNEACLGALDFMGFLVDDPNTQVIAAYIEGFRNATRLSNVAESALRNQKPIVILKSGRTPGGARAAASHTASLAGSDQVYDAVFRQKGILRAEGIDEMFNMTRLLVKGKIPHGNKIAMIGISGGAGVVVADYCHEMDLELITLKDETRSALQKLLPPFASISNPVDTAGAGADAFRNSLETIIENETVDIVIVSQAIGVIGDEATKVAQSIVDLSQSTDKLIIVLWMGAKFTEQAYAIIESNDLPLFKTPLSCMQAIKGAVTYRRYLDRFEASQQAVSKTPIHVNLEQAERLIEKLGSGTQTEYDAKRLLQAYGISVTREDLATSHDQAVEIAHQIGYPVALKLQSSQIAHKTEAKIIQLNLSTDEDLRSAYNEILKNGQHYKPDAHIQGILVQEMLEPAYEVIVGVTQDPHFGPTIMFGLGGIFVELLKDVALRIAPLSQKDAEEMTHEIKGVRILEGYRGMQPADYEGIVNVLRIVSQMAVDLQDKITEIDINPLFVFETGRGVKAADALVVLK